MSDGTDVSPEARAVADALERAAYSGRVSVQDLEHIAARIPGLHVRLQLPPAPSVGHLETQWKRCGRRNCACATSDEARHGPYVYHVVAQGPRRVRRYLGRLGVAKAPPDLGERLRAELDAARERFHRQMGFLHD